MANPAVYTPQSRSLSEKTKLLLWVRAGGRCEFDGCNEYLFRHHVTLEAVNLGELAHIVAFSPEGPRGKDGDRPEQINDPSNLMLLCPRCHKLIDTTGSKYSRSLLQRHKKEHEDRIFRLTEAKPERKTTVLQLLAKVGGQPVAIPEANIWDAVAPMYPTDEKGCVIDLTNLDDQTDAYYAVAAEEIKRAVESLYRSGLHVEAPRHLSVFALAAMPLLMYLGRCLSNKVPADFYQRHRDTQDWTWKDAGPEVCYTSCQVRRGTDEARVALLLSLTDRVGLADLPASIDGSYSVYEITLEEQTPSAYFLRRRVDLDGFRRIYQAVLAEIMRDHRNVSAVDVFPIVPAPIAVLCGFELFPKISPALKVYDRDRRRGGWSYVLTVV
jgi:CBASS immunity sensor of nucleotide second messenger signals/HNH endonuclease